MPKEILLYASIYSYNVADFINQIEEAKGEDIVVRVNTPGGVVTDLYGAVAKFKEHPKGKLVKVDGRAASAGAILCCYADEVECLDVSVFLFHRAAWPEWYESNPAFFTDQAKAELNKMNASLRAAMEGKMKAEDFQKVTGVSYDDLFSLDNRIDVTLDAKQAKKLGLVNKVTPITPEKKAEIEGYVMAIAAMSVPKLPEPQQTQPQNKEVMTLAELKQQHPSVYAEAHKEGVTQERDRVGAFMAFVDIDPTAVAKGIKDGDTLSQTTMAELTRKALSTEKVAAIQGSNAPAVTTEQPAAQPTAEEKNLADFNAAVKAKLAANRH